ncbi:MAG: glycosyl hydrolase [Bacteroidetes bacterium]|nr:glycosyl hydrolase [Bacteroidota bacterium]
MRLKLIQLFLIPLLVTGVLFAQDEEKEKKDPLQKENFSGLKWRNIGPALTSGRIADFAINPKNNSEYFVAVASGHVWKTTNAGITFDPVFENQGAYSIGCVTLDPNNQHVVWVGTGENNHQRALGYGNGVYKSVDGGKSWKNMGLKDSRQIGDIVIDPRNSNIVFVAAEGSVWGPGGERGLYKTVDGGKTWKKVLEISTNTGVNNVTFDSRNPDIMYATSEQRRRHVYGKIGGGPESAVYKSEDGGETWEKIMKGLPSVHLGGMGIDISPVNPDVLYLIVEAAENQSGFYRSTNRGATWEKMSDYASSGQYFNEIYCDPKDVDKVYSMEVVSRVTTDAGKTWVALGVDDRHVDDHALWINPSNTNHLLIGGDGGIYESFDGGKLWDFKENLPVTQFYRVFADNSAPFYNVYGGTQDNSSMGGPSRTLSSDGIVNSDWFITNGGDGFWSAVDPENPDIVYAESQYAGMVRYDKKSGEAIDIRPEPGKGEKTYKWNWDTPLFISPHKNTRLYTAANMVFRTNDRGDNWEVISPDLTTGIDRNSFPVMDKYWGVDAVAKDRSTSLFGTIVSLAESPVKENLLYAGTDDGLIQITEDAKTWSKAGSFPGVPEYTYVSDVLPSRFNENVVYASFNNHLRDDFKPYILKSEDKGKSWKPISASLPENGSVWSIAEDFENPNLLFAGTEFGFFFTVDGGNKWIKLQNGLPDIPVRDIFLHKREGDIVIATFGRGFYILDDYTPLRSVTNELLQKDGHIFGVRDGLMFIEMAGRYGTGNTYYKAPNPEFGVNITYYIKEVPKTLKEIRKAKEADLFKEGKPIPIPTDAELDAEQREVAPYLLVWIEDETGQIVRKLTKPATKGVNRINWDLKHQMITNLKVDKFNSNMKTQSSNLVMPGKFTATIFMVDREGVSPLADNVEFKAEALRNTTLPAVDRAELVKFQSDVRELSRIVRGTYIYLTELIGKVNALKQAALYSPSTGYEPLRRVDRILDTLNTVLLKFERKSNFPSAEENPPSPVTINERLNTLLWTHWRSTSGVTKNERVAYDVLKSEFPPLYEIIKRMAEVEVRKLEDELDSFGGYLTPGRLPELK